MWAMITTILDSVCRTCTCTCMNHSWSINSRIILIRKILFYYLSKYPLLKGWQIENASLICMLSASSDIRALTQ